MHELIGMIAAMQSAANHETVRDDDCVVFSNASNKMRMHRMTPKRDMETYSGKYYEEGEIKDQYRHFGNYKYTITWKDVEATGQKGEYTFEHEEKEGISWNLIYNGCDISFEGGKGLIFTVKYTAILKSNSRKYYPVYVTGHCSLD